MIIKSIGQNRILLTTTDRDVNELINSTFRLEIGMKQIVAYKYTADTLITRVLVKEKIQATLQYVGDKNNGQELYDYTLQLNDVIQVHEVGKESYTKVIFDIV